MHYVESRQSSRTRANFFHRLVGANKNNGAAVFSCVYDRFGNRWQQNGPNSMQLTFTGNNPGNPQNNNRIDGYSYDAAGNLLNDGVHSYAYNAENRITSVDAGSTATYLYDARNHAVTKTIFATDSQGEFAGSWDFLYDQSDRLITETAGNGSGALWRSEVFAGSRHLETSWDGNQYIDHADHLGTERARFDTNYSTWSTSTGLPFGDATQWNTSYGISQSAFNLTGKERDAESGLDNFGARYMSSQFGRFMSPDPSNQSVDFELPQTWNRYSYVLNNPLSMVGRNGQWPTYTHNEIINEAFPGMSSSDLKVLYDASKEVDTHQEAYNSWMHGMSDGTDPNRAEAIYVAMQLGDQQITKDEAEARVDQAKWVAEGHTGLSPTALMKFGNALHIITDRLSPAHAGYQPWYGQSAWNPSAWLHFLHEANPWDPNVSTSVQAAQGAFQQTFGMGWDEFDLMQLQNQQPQRACVTTDDGLGNVTTTCN